MNKNDVIFFGILAALAMVLVAGIALLKNYLEKPHYQIQVRPIVVIPLDEIKLCSDKDGVIVVREGKWSCVGNKP
jgi:hypothetical protein